MELVKVLEPILKFEGDIEYCQSILRTPLQYNSSGDGENCITFDIRNREAEGYYHNEILYYKLKIQL
jgi:hypothetical protein